MMGTFQALLRLSVGSPEGPSLSDNVLGEPCIQAAGAHGFGSLGSRP